MLPPYGPDEDLGFPSWHASLGGAQPGMAKGPARSAMPVLGNATFGVAHGEGGPYRRRDAGADLELRSGH